MVNRPNVTKGINDVAVGINVVIGVLRCDVLERENTGSVRLFGRFAGQVKSGRGEETGKWRHTLVGVGCVVGNDYAGHSFRVVGGILVHHSNPVASENLGRTDIRMAVI